MKTKEEVFKVYRYTNYSGEYIKPLSSEQFKEMAGEAAYDMVKYGDNYKSPNCTYTRIYRAGSNAENILSKKG